MPHLGSCTACGARASMYHLSVWPIYHYRRDPLGVLRGKGRIPVADYSLAAQVMDRMSTYQQPKSMGGISTGSSDALSTFGEAPGIIQIGGVIGQLGSKEQPPSVGTVLGQASTMTSNLNGISDAKLQRGVYSFCMCPGGQVISIPLWICFLLLTYQLRVNPWFAGKSIHVICP